MRSIRSRDTSLETTVRQALHALGYRFRKHMAGIPGRPDVVFTRRKAAIFLHGCFWHQHPGCSKGRMPKVRPEYWEPKLVRNQERDRDAQDKLARAGWRMLVIWECQWREDQERTLAQVREFLGPPRPSGLQPGKQKGSREDDRIDR